MRRFLTTLLIGLVAIPLTAQADEDFNTLVPMREASATTFYVFTQIEGIGSVDLMVDTGSGLMTINEDTLAVLQKQQRVRFVKHLEGILADGRKLVVPVYAIERMSIGKNCWLNNIEAAVFPGQTRQILGLSALRKAAPFVFSIDPPQLMLSRCNGDSLAVSQSVAEVNR